MELVSPTGSKAFLLKELSFIWYNLQFITDLYFQAYIPL